MGRQFFDLMPVLGFIVVFTKRTREMLLVYISSFSSALSRPLKKVEAIPTPLLEMVTDGLVEAHPTEILKNISTGERVIS